MGIDVTSRWCVTCGTAHRGPETCPGDLPATGAERPAWRVNVETPFGRESIGVLLAPSHQVWRARIITYPNVLWALPGGRGTMKFVGDTREEAKALAIAFIDEHVRAKRYVRRDGLAIVGGDAKSASTRASAPIVASARRKTATLPLRWGPERAGVRGVTCNVSPDGMFIAAVAPGGGGQSLRIHLDLDGHTVPLRGLVMWNRRRSEPGLPLGMGIRLSEPPPLYRSFVASLP